MEKKTEEIFVSTCSYLTFLIDQLSTSETHLPPDSIISINGLVTKLLGLVNHLARKEFQSQPITNDSVKQEDPHAVEAPPSTNRSLKSGGIENVKRDIKETEQPCVETAAKPSPPPGTERNIPVTERNQKIANSQPVNKPSDLQGKNSLNGANSLKVAGVPSPLISETAQQISSKSKVDQPNDPLNSIDVYITKKYHGYVEDIMAGLISSENMSMYCRLCDQVTNKTFVEHSRTGFHVMKSDGLKKLKLYSCLACKLCIYGTKNLIFKYFKFHYYKIHQGNSEAKLEDILIEVEANISASVSSASSLPNLNGVGDEVNTQNPGQTTRKQQSSMTKSKQTSLNSSIESVSNALKMTPLNDSVSDTTSGNTPNNAKDLQLISSQIIGAYGAPVTPPPFSDNPSAIKTTDASKLVAPKAVSSVTSKGVDDTLSGNVKLVEHEKLKLVSATTSTASDKHVNVSSNKATAGNKSDNIPINKATAADIPTNIPSNIATAGSMPDNIPINKASAIDKPANMSSNKTIASNKPANIPSPKTTANKPISAVDKELGYSDLPTSSPPPLKSGKQKKTPASSKKDNDKKGEKIHIENNISRVEETNTVVEALPSSQYPEFDRILNYMRDEWLKSSILIDVGFCEICNIGISSGFDWFTHVDDHMMNPGSSTERPCSKCSLKVFASDPNKFFNLPIHKEVDKCVRKT